MIKLLKTLRVYKLQIVLIILLVFLQSLADLYLPRLMANIIDNGVVKGDTDYIKDIGVWMILVTFGGVICSVFASYLSAKVSSGFGRNTRNKVFTHVENFSLQEFDKLGTSSLITRTTNDITQVQNVINMILRMMISAPLMAIGGIIMAVNQDKELSLVLVFVLPVLAALIFFVSRKGIPYFNAMQIKLDKLNQVVREQLTGIRVIRAFNRNDYEINRFNKANQDLTQTALKVNRIMALLMPGMMLVMNIAIVAIVWFGSKRIDNMSMQVGDLMAFIQYAMQIMMSLVMVSFMFVIVPRGAVSAARINEVLEIMPLIKDNATNKEFPANNGVVEFKNVTFSYPGAEKPALYNISFVARPGETTAIIGGTGSGKSTLINLIPRFYDVSSGNVLVDEIDIKEQTQESLRQKIAYVPQKALLFSGSITENIKYGKETATDEEVKQAAIVAQAYDFISEIDGDFSANLSQGATNISGGQKQRLSIARAIVRKAKIYLFDDSFSALDFKTDAKLRSALKSELANSTVIIVAQRVSTVMNADQIIVLDNGVIVGTGTHKELMNTSEVYREIVSSQLLKEELA
ncbi:MAG: transporter-like protein [Bacillales bacterium]|nr:transporter-like protein [Bacillales bacterium]